MVWIFEFRFGAASAIIFIIMPLVWPGLLIGVTFRMQMMCVANGVARVRADGNKIEAEHNHNSDSKCY